ncbi:hypothetical protein [Geomesophilobacter sediminis]|uniref:Uncharacterized protein n=1 Tax=Geomesophilobacter sediminis TaxID=2798584 RepID=A0A8J7JLQ9_9BACT|nr:hypothetical protein [Geomesophilobacter sediminis]MBJ6725295.1 hypothetical protein [Geomesophilobacter sediminis]
MTTFKEKMRLWPQFTLREALLIGFCATFVIITRAGLRLHLHLPGHVMLFTMFFYLLARGCVPKIGSAALVGLLASLASLVLGMGMPGMVFVKYLLPALVIEAALLLFPSSLEGMLACAAVGLIAATSRALVSSGVEWLMGLEEEIILSKALFIAVANGIFGGLGALAVPSVLRVLRKNGLIESTGKR